jgi:hypothetical protein
LDSKADFVLEKRNPCPNPRPNRLRNQTLNSPIDSEQKIK